MIKKNLNTILLFFFLLVSLNNFGQIKISGQIVDKNTKRPLPFVNIVYSTSQKSGTTSDLDGRFSILSLSKIDSITCSFIGYQDKTIHLTRNATPLIIELESETYQIPDVIVYAKENPALRIIKKAIKNRKKNNPKSLKYFSYETYNKMFFTFDIFYYKNGDTLSSCNYMSKDTLNQKIDKNLKEINKFNKNQYLFLMESVTKKQYKHPNKVHEEVIASRVSGLKNPTIALIGTQLQSFTIYNNYISILGKTYLSPLAQKSYSKYLFIIEDTLINAPSDTIFTLTYRPRKNKNFNGLEGIIQINTKESAVINFSTKPTEQEGLSVIIRQKYKLIQDSIWFPYQLDADIIFKNILGANNSNKDQENAPDNTYIYGKSKTYIKKINLNPEFKNRDFSHIAVDYQNEANQKDSLFWSQYRINTISEKELRTYKSIDSLGNELNFDKKLRWLSALSKGEIPLGPLSMHLEQLMKFNMAEGYRLGLGLSTNERVFKNLQLGAYSGYGFTDKQWKYGGNLKVNLRDYYDSNIKLQYQNDIIEVGGFSFLEANSFMSQETFRDYLIKDIVYQEKVELNIEARFLYYLKTQFYFNFSDTKYSDKNYEIKTNNNTFASQFLIPEVGLKMRYAYHEMYMRTPMGIEVLKNNYPVFFINISKSVIYDTYNLDYTRIWGKVQKQFTLRNLGVSSFSLQAGWAQGDLPYHKLYNGHGSYYSFSLVAFNSFGAMRLNEFISDRFVYLFYRHNFGKLLFKTSKFQPEFSLVQNMGWGDLSQEKRQTGITNKTMEKGYFESGLIIDNLFSNNTYIYGLGVYYRYGPYALEIPIDNWSFKLSLKFKLFSQQ